MSREPEFVYEVSQISLVQWGVPDLILEPLKHISGVNIYEFTIQRCRCWRFYTPQAPCQHVQWSPVAYELICDFPLSGYT